MLLFILYLSILIIVLAFLFVVSFFLSESFLGGVSREEATSYECGFEHNALSRIPLSLRYFMLTVVFLVFDMEVVLLLFVPFSLASNFSYSIVLLSSTSFVLLLGLGLFYEWSDGSLEWIL